MDEEGSIEDIDERRLHRKAYDYLCRLVEVRKWLADCLKDEDSIPRPVEIEQNFRNGVLLARLGNVFAPEVVPLRMIFDISQEKFHGNEDTPVYKHTDNIVAWRKAVLSVHLPEIIIPETVDVYEGRNIQTIFCLYALAALLFRLRKTPPLRVLAGKAQFSAEELEEMKTMLRDRKLPEFGAVGDFLSQVKPKEGHDMSAVNDAIDNENAEELLVALQKASLLFVEERLSVEYLQLLMAEKRKEENNAMDREKVQGAVLLANDRAALREIHLLMESSESSSDQLMVLLDLLQFEQTPELALPLALQLLRERGKWEELTKQSVSEAVQEAVALLEVKVAVQQGSSHDCLRALRNPILRLNPREENALLYYNRFHYSYDKAPVDFFLSRRELASTIEEFDDLAPEHRDFLELKDKLKKRDTGTIDVILKRIFGKIFIEENTDYYMRRMKEKQPETVDDAREILEEVNGRVHEMFSRAETVVRINSSAAKKDAADTRLRLTAAAGDNGMTSFRRELVHWYVNALIEETTERRRTKGPEGKTWLQEDFELGAVWMATDDHSRSTKPQEPLTNNCLPWKEIEELVKKENGKFEDYYKVNEDKVKTAQGALRNFLDRQRRRAEEMCKRQQEMAASKIQSQYRKYRHSKDQQELKECERPSLELVQKFVGEFKEREQDVQDQMEVEERRGRVWQLKMANQQLDGQLRTLDEQIGLLVRNRINLQEVMANKQKIADTADSFSFRPASMRKKKSDQQALLQQLFFYLQAEPEYMATLLLSEERRDPKGFSVIKDCLSPTFGFVTVQREAFLLTRVLAEILLRKIEKINKPEELNSGMEEEIIAKVFEEGLFDLGQQTSAGLPTLPPFEGAFNLDPEDAYLSMRGHKADSTQQAVSDPEVQQVLEASKEFIAEASERMTEAVAKGFRAPPALRYLCIFAADALRRQLPSAPVADVFRAVAVFAFRVHLRHLLHSKTTMEGKDAHGRLQSVLQFLEYAVANRGYGNSKWYLTALNKQIHIISLQFEEITEKLVAGSLDSVFGLNEFTHFDPSNKPILSLLETQLVTLLNYLKINAPSLGPGTGSRVQGLLSKCSAPEKAAADRTIVLHLRPADEENGEEKGDEHFVRAKQLVIELLVQGAEATDLSELCEKELPENMQGSQKELKKLLDELVSSGRIPKEDNYQQILTDIANDIRLAARRRMERETATRTLGEVEKTLLEQREELRARLVRYEQYLETCLENLNRTSKRLSIRTDTRSAEKVTKARRSLDGPKSIKNSAEKLFRKGILVDIRVPGKDSVKRQSKLQMEVANTTQKGVFQITVFDGKAVAGDAKLDFQELLKAEAAEQTKMSLGGDLLVLDVTQTINFINKKFYSQ